MINIRQTSIKNLSILVVEAFAEYVKTGNERKYLGYETYLMLRELTWRITRRNHETYLIDEGPDIISEVVGELMTRVKRKFDSNKEFIIDDLYHYLSRMINNRIAASLSDRYYKNTRGESELIILEDIDGYLEELCETTPSKYKLAYPEAVLLFESEISEMIGMTKRYLSQNNTTNKMQNLLVWPVIVAAFRNRPDLVERFDKRTSMYLKYVIYIVRKLINKKFKSYRHIFA